MSDVNIDSLRLEERYALKLKNLYAGYGYDEYKLSGFEDYSLYAENKSFLDGKGVLSFSVGGKMLALRPDVTLSVIKNVNVCGGVQQKLYYDERVYRKAAGGGEFSELRQIGVEVIGKIDGATETEVCGLTLKTLATVGGDKYVLDVSHAGIIEKVLNKLGDINVRKQATEFLESKNAHDFRRFAEQMGVDREYADAFSALINISSEPGAALKTLERLNQFIDISDEIVEMKTIFDGENKYINVNFSIGGDADYYNGLVFKGYVEGVPYAVLSGGRYDRLLGKFGKSAEAIGFALYLGELGNYFTNAPVTPDAIVVYNDDSARAALIKADKLRAEGLRVRLCKSVGDFDGKVFYAEEGNNA